MRSCQPYEVSSSPEDIQAAMQEMDDSAEMADQISYAYTLIRSDSQRDVMMGLDYLKHLRPQERDRAKVEYYTIFAMYRLNQDDQILKQYQNRNNLHPNSVKIIETVKKEKNQDTAITVAAIFGTVATIVGVALTAIFSKRK